MSQAFLACSVVLAAMLVLPLVRIVRGPTVFDRLLGAGAMGTKTMILLVLVGATLGRVDMYVDISLGYGLALVVGTIVSTKYLETYAARKEAAEQATAEGRSEDRG